MTDIIWERIVAIFGMTLWLAFPIGIILSIIRLDRMAHRTAFHQPIFHPQLSGAGPYHFAFHAAGESGESSEKKDEDYKEHNEEWEEESMENEGGPPSEEENPLLHYLKGREKLHEKGGMNPPGE